MSVLYVKDNGEWKPIQSIKGENGPYFTPHVDTDGNLSWTNNGGLVNPPTVNIKGESGDVTREEYEQLYGEVAEIEVDKADRDLSNLSETGQAKFDEKADVDYVLNKSQITNCITEVPQRIKIELTDGTLILKAGSEVIVPNGFEADGTTPKFDYVTVESDINMPNYTTTAGQRMWWVVLPNDYANGVVQYCFSGNTSTMNSITPNHYSTFYNTETNKMYRGNGTAWEELRFSLPICLATNDDTSAVTSIDQVFNGFGYFGSTFWVDKGVKILSSNGWNNDGSYKNIEGHITEIKLLTTTNTGAKTLGLYFNQDGSYNGFSQGIYEYTIKSLKDRPTTWTSGVWVYVEDENRVYVNQNITPSNVVMLADITITNNGITKFDVNETFRAVDYNEFSNTPHITETYQNGASWYRVWSDGYCEQGVTSTIVPKDGSLVVNLLKNYSNTNYIVLPSEIGTTTDSATSGNFTFKKSTNSFTVYNNGYAKASHTMQYKVCGYI